MFYILIGKGFKMKSKKLWKMAAFLVATSHLSREVENPVFEKKFKITRKEFSDKFQKYRRSKGYEI